MKKLVNKIKDTLSIFSLSKGFTLLELLVVVLIIGILAAIALPQYNKAVAKADLFKIINITKSIKLAQERYYLTNDIYSTDMNSLDITTENHNANCIIGKDRHGNYVYCYNNKFAFWIYLNRKYTECAAKTTDTNSPLASACKTFLKSNTCGVTTLTSCSRLGINPCFYCYNSTNQIF